MAQVTENKRAATGNTAHENKTQEETMIEEIMMLKTREAFEKVKAELKAGENSIPEGAAQETVEAGNVTEEEGSTLSEGEGPEVTVLDGLLESIFGGAAVHIDSVHIHIGDHMESVNFMGDTEAGREEIEEADTGDGDDAQEDSCDCCDECGFGTRHPIYVDTDLMEKVVAVATGIERKTVAAVLKGVSLYLQVLAEDEEDHDGR